jgi:hypothetical protein
MGREATCTCNWAGANAQVKALIEPPELILRGGIRRRLPLAELKNVQASGGNLHFQFAGESVSLALGGALAAKWAQAVTAPPPSLAKKLGIASQSTICVIGEIDDVALHDALAAAQPIANSKADLIIARVDTPGELAHALKSAAKELAAGKPIWFVYPKGRGHALAENDVRTMGLTAGLVDTKVASVSPRLTALRFVKRKG